MHSYFGRVETERVKENCKVPLCGDISSELGGDGESETPGENSNLEETGTRSTPSDRKVRRILLSIRRQSIEMAMSPGRASNPEPPRSPSQSTEIHADGAVRTIRQRPTKLCRTSAAGMYLLLYTPARLGSSALIRRQLIRFSDGRRSPLRLTSHGAQLPELILYTSKTYSLRL
jgi:hypothetical protein